MARKTTQKTAKSAVHTITVSRDVEVDGNFQATTKAGAILHSPGRTPVTLPTGTKICVFSVHGGIATVEPIDESQPPGTMDEQEYDRIPGSSCM